MTHRNAGTFSFAFLQAKITLKVDDEKQMNEIYAAARQAGLPCVVIEDAGE